MKSWNNSGESIPLTSSFSSDGMSGSLNKVPVLQNASSMQSYYTTDRSTRNNRDMPYNTSTFRDPYLHQTKLSSDTVPRKNYAPMNQQLADQLSTRNIHPVARYASSNADPNHVRYQNSNYHSPLYSHTPTAIQYYPNMLGNDLPLVELGKAQSNLNNFMEEGPYTCLRSKSNQESGSNGYVPVTQTKTYLPSLTPQVMHKNQERNIKSVSSSRWRDYRLCASKSRKHSRLY